MSKANSADLRERTASSVSEISFMKSIIECLPFSSKCNSFINKRTFGLIILFSGSFLLYLQLSQWPRKLRKPERVLLRIWDGPAPHSDGKDLPSAILPNPHHPSLEVFLPELMNVDDSPRPAMIVLPGGGYRFLSDREYEPPSTWLAEAGVVAFALRYRIGPEYQYPTQVG